MKTTNILESIIAISAVTILISCKKEIDGPQNNLNACNKVTPAAQVSYGETRTPLGYDMRTEADSTSVSIIKCYKTIACLICLTNSPAIIL